MTIRRYWMKKWLGMVSSALAGILTFVFMALATIYFKASMTVAGNTTSNTETETAYNLIKESVSESSPKGFGLYKVMTIVMIVVAVLLMLWAIVMLLQNLNVLKLKFNLNLVNAIILAVFAVVAIIALIALFVMGGDLSGEALGASLKVGPAVGAWLNTVVAVLACAGGVTAMVMKKSK